MTVFHVAFDNYAGFLKEHTAQILAASTSLVLGIAIVLVFLRYRPALAIFRRRDYSTDPDEFRTFDEQAALDEWKRDNEHDS